MRVLTDRLFGRGRTPPPPTGWRSPVLFHTHVIVPVQEFHWYSREFSFLPVQFSLLFSFGVMNVDPCDPPPPPPSPLSGRYLRQLSGGSPLFLPLGDGHSTQNFPFCPSWLSDSVLEEAARPPSLRFHTSVKTHLTLRSAFISCHIFLQLALNRTQNMQLQASCCSVILQQDLQQMQVTPQDTEQYFSFSSWNYLWNNISFSLTGTLCRECLAFLNLTFQMGHYLKRPWDWEENTHTQTHKVYTNVLHMYGYKMRGGNNIIRSRSYWWDDFHTTGVCLFIRLFTIKIKKMIILQHQPWLFGLLSPSADAEGESGEIQSLLFSTSCGKPVTHN